MVIADTGFWFALANRKDRHHEAAVRCLNELDQPLITTWPVMTETCHLLLSRVGVDAQLRFLDSLGAGAFHIFTLQPEHETRIIELMKKYRDLPMDLADASLVLLAEHLGHGRIFSTDRRDFQSYRWKNNRPFNNLLLVE